MTLLNFFKIITISISLKSLVLFFSQKEPTNVTDTISLNYLTGSKITWKEDLSGASFSIDNPNATSSCGCGTSFSVT